MENAQLLKHLIDLLILDINEFVNEDNPVRHGSSYKRLSMMIEEDRAEIKKTWDSIGDFPMDEETEH